MPVCRILYRSAVLTAALFATIPAFAQGYSNIVNRLSGLTIDDTNASKSAGNQMQQWACNGQQQQNWLLTPSGSSTYTIKNQLSGMYLKSTSTANGTIIVQDPSDGGSDENWSITMDASGYNVIENQYSGKVLDVTNASTQNGAKIQQWASNTQQQQEWILVPAGDCTTGQLSVTTSTPGAGTNTAWQEFTIPANAELTSLLGTLTLNNSQNIMSEVLFSVGYVPGGCTASSGTGSFPANTTVWNYILKNPKSGLITVPISYLPPVLPRLSTCLMIAMGGGPLDGTGDSVTVAGSLTVTWLSGTSSSYAVGLGAEYCYDHGGCTKNTSPPYSSGTTFATVYQVTTTSTLNYIWGDISDSTFDANSPYPTGSWSVPNNVYVYPSSSCTQFGSGTTFNGPGNYYSTMPPNTYQLLNVPLSGSGIQAQNSGIYSVPNNEIVYAGQCIVALTELNSSTGGAFDNEAQIFMILTPQ